MGLGWLFGKKRTLPQNTLSGTRNFNENTFNFSKKFGGETVIEPEQIQNAAGFNLPFNLPELDKPAKSATARQIFSASPVSSAAPTFIPSAPAGNSKEPLFVKVDVYQQVLGELEQVRGVIAKMQSASRTLENSEYNEENNFDKLKKSMKSAHDKMLQMDKILFNAKGE